MKKLLYAFLLLTFACDSDRECCEIINKIYADNQYVFVGAFASSINNPPGEK